MGLPQGRRVKQFWVDLRNWDKEMATSALEAGAHAVLVEPARVAQIKALGLIKTVSAEGADLTLGSDVHETEIVDKASEVKALELSRGAISIVTTTDWSVIPLENLVSQSSSIYALVRSEDEARLALEVLEHGVAGIVLAPADRQQIVKVAQLVGSIGDNMDLVEATIKAIKPLGSGDRVCIDTCTNMKIGEGMLVGNSSSGMLLVHSESIENPYVEPRPFRVNAGGVHAYTIRPGGKTCYLSELKAGDEVLVINAKGEGQAAYVGRVKIERRPMLLVEAEAEGAPITLIAQNAETIRLTSPEGQPVSVVELKPGDKVLGYVESAGRHFGVKVDETIVER